MAHIFVTGTGVLNLCTSYVTLLILLSAADYEHLLGAHRLHEWQGKVVYINAL